MLSWKFREVFLERLFYKTLRNLKTDKPVLCFQWGETFSSLLVARYFLLVTFCSLLFVRCSLLFACCSLLFASCSLLFAPCSLLLARYFLLVARYFLLVTFCSLLVTFLVTFCLLLVARQEILKDFFSVKINKRFSIWICTRSLICE